MHPRGPRGHALRRRPIPLPSETPGPCNSKRARWHFRSYLGRMHPPPILPSCSGYSDLVRCGETAIATNNKNPASGKISKAHSPIDRTKQLRSKSGVPAVTDLVNGCNVTFTRRRNRNGPIANGSQLAPGGSLTALRVPTKFMTLPTIATEQKKHECVALRRETSRRDTILG